MNAKTEYVIDRRRLKPAVRRMMDFCFWKNSPHWSSRQNQRRKDYSKQLIRVAYFESLNWFAFNFCGFRFHSESVLTIAQLPEYDRFFFEDKPRKGLKFTAWCIDGKHFPSVLLKLSQFQDLEFEFVAAPSCRGVIPKPFVPLNLSFYERSRKN